MTYALTGNTKHVSFYQVQTATVANPRNGRDPWSSYSYRAFDTTPFALAALAEVKSQYPRKRHRVVRVTKEVVVE
jgi:hypothetical protein